MVLSLEKQWIWDSWYAHDGQQWHAYFLKADKSLGDPDLRHFNVSQGHAVSPDLKIWTHLGTTIAPSQGPAFDDRTTWTGSVIQAPDGTWHQFHTGGAKAEKGLYQRIGHSTSTDMHNWHRVNGDGFCLDIAGPNAKHYEREHMVGHWQDRAMRDPFVMKDPTGDGYLMYFTARAPNIEEPNAGGAIGFATSPDLYDWTLQKPVFVGGFGQLEVPQVFEINNKWYCLFCTAKEHWSKQYAQSFSQKPVTGNHYLIGDSPRGPWRIAPGNFFDGDDPCRRYAARMIETENGWVIIGFADNGKENFGGYILDPVAVEIDGDGLLSVAQHPKAAE